MHRQVANPNKWIESKIHGIFCSVQIILKRTYYWLITAARVLQEILYAHGSFLKGCLQKSI